MERETLESETNKWLKKLESEIANLEKDKITEKKVAEEFKNIEAYISDCKHFLKGKDYVRAFEAIVYAWGIFDSLRRLGLVRTGSDIEPDATSDK